MGSKNSVYISVPVNISRNMIMSIREICTDSEVFSSSKKYYADDMAFLEKIKQGKIEEIPDIIVTIRPEILWEKNYLADSGYFDGQYRYDVDNFIGSKGFIDERWILKPVFIMPLIIFYNTNVQNPPESWESLMESRFKGNILCTNENTPPAILFRRFYTHSFGHKGKDFVDNSVNYRGLPIDVNIAVGKGEYDIGIMPISFAKFSRDNSADFCWPSEGALPLMQVMIMKNSFRDDSKKAADFLISEKTQQIFSKSAGFIPVIPDVTPPLEFLKNNRNLLWRGWDSFVDMAHIRHEVHLTGGEDHE
ncbi:MAG: ABC transporter substrate-binding protein [Proteobacteria bacterium]|nr:ABC transporter substrate-binding protein [Pseudomonadota bacterium]